MDKHSFEIGVQYSVSVGGRNPLLVIAGPCVIESREHALRHADKIAQIVREVGLPLVFKSSYDKANRTSLESYRGVGMEQGLRILSEIRQEFAVPVVSDVHTALEAQNAGEVLDLLQIPAFLCRQTDLLIAAGATNKPVMIKKGQFLAAEDLRFSLEKVVQGGSDRVLLCERGSCFGYRDLVVDLRNLVLMGDLGCPVVFDATHSVQTIGGAGGVATGERRFIAPLARGAVASGVSGVFLECHENPETAPSDGRSMLPLAQLKTLLIDLKHIAELNLQTREARSDDL